MSFRKQKYGEITFQSPELYIVRNADRLDAIGAIGIARIFSYGGMVGRPFYDPVAEIKTYASIAEYRKDSASSIILPLPNLPRLP